MSYRFFLLTFMVIGMCDTFGETKQLSSSSYPSQSFWRNNLPIALDESTSLDVQLERDTLSYLEPASRAKRFDDSQNIANSFYKGRRTSKNSVILKHMTVRKSYAIYHDVHLELEIPDARYTIFNYGPSNSMRDLRVLNRSEKKFARSTRCKSNKRQVSGRVRTVPTNRLFDNDGARQSTRNWKSNAKRPNFDLEVAGKVRSNNLDSATDESNARRFYWEPIFDGGVIESIGSLFSDRIKDEANRERIEREEIRNEKLIKKYTALLNDPEQYKKLQQESANSPSYINQVIRRTLLPRLEEEMREYSANKPL
ncbi:uncharacterized protein LOC124181548 isoform X3 [Neodiprion fabricii]|uniref:uncharacterized protein LOC124181548 isoform X3 n=1 Tax=Neodiprion fabricii TaxID=2872261 RepID=UPI001ED947C4|nr:uncharacterized protein LOC124181548 isoform X3 [Neodiprion fabricii]XP_046424199.1 uncharacterized protein LOC124181548 isoform X3 [Neodiprion fabricii]